MKCLVSTSSPSLKKSINFYETLNFEHFESDAKHFVCAKGLIIQIDERPIFRSGLKIYDFDIERQLEKLKALTHVEEFEDSFVFEDPSGSRVYLMKDSFAFAANVEAASKMGNYAGYSIECLDFDLSVRLYQFLGFEITMGGIEQGWISMKAEDETVISIMKANACPHQFLNPSLSFFNGKNNADIIKEISSLNIPIHEEITIFNEEGLVDNIILKDPGGLGFFLFND